MNHRQGCRVIGTLVGDLTILDLLAESCLVSTEDGGQPIHLQLLL